ncbi:hypothetical protein GCM10010435_14740 [Winogradskya consettensis]|uniref:DUF3817 domain-containing protein n=1 Tax=Winogradskya consettensis TaxID=113560 RepID=A0A919VMS8_9ACTN|nr:DUF3817 domain-containing protein [Actinoplanes consettensis]GIM69165.1 hypothetical protein Aco04nite_14010 [Actinoplanes consettensis]
MPPSPLLRTAATIELTSIILLLTNLATVHWQAIATLLGPLHGCAYLAVIGTTLRESPDTRTRLLALLPGAGGLLTARRIRATPEPDVPTPA